MELRHLRYFVVTAQLEHFGRAAARLAIVQPALSKQIAALEAELGVALFERLPRGVRLTAAGCAFRDEAERLLRAAEAAAARARDVAGGKIGRLRVGFVDTAIYHPILPRIIQAFRAAHPEVQLDLVQEPSAVQGELLRAGTLNVGFVFHRPAELATLRAQPILSERIRLAIPRAHPFARRRRVTLAALRDEPFVWIPRALSPRFHDAVFAACAKKNFVPRIVQEGGSDQAILSLVAAGVGLSFCVASSEQRKPADVTLLDVSDLGLTVHLDAIWRDDDRNPALAAFIAAIRAGLGR